MVLNEKLYLELVKEFFFLLKKNQGVTNRLMLLGKEFMEHLKARVSEADLVYIKHRFDYEDHRVKLRWVSILIIFISAINI